MKNYHILTNALYIISRLVFGFIFLFIVVVVIAEFSTTNGKIGSGHLSIHHSQGYPIQVNISTNIKKVHYSETEKNQDIPIKFSKLISQGYQLSHSTGVGTQYKIIDYIPAGEVKFEKINFDHFPYLKTNIYIKTDSSLINFILGFRTYFFLLYYLVISFYSTKIFKKLKNDQIFQLEISKYLNIIGAIIVLMELYNIISYQFIDKKLIELIDLRNYKIFSGCQLHNIYQLSLTPFVLGLLFFLLALIFKRGYDIHKENELTL
jgi:hypothetical protein